MVGSHDDDVEAAFLQHAGERAFPVVNGEPAVGVVPVKGDGGVDTFFIIVIVVLVFIQRETSVRAGIDAQFDGVSRLFSRGLNEWSHGDDGAGLDQERNLVNGSIRYNCLPAGKSLSGPKVHPLSSGRQINQPVFFPRRDDFFAGKNFRGLPEELGPEGAEGVVGGLTGKVVFLAGLQLRGNGIGFR
jgi:hypothetical protein